MLNSELENKIANDTQAKAYVGVISNADKLDALSIVKTASDFAIYKNPNETDLNKLLKSANESLIAKVREIQKR